MSDSVKTSSEKKNKLLPINDVTFWLVLAIVVLVPVTIYLGYNFFTENFELKNKELTLWVLFMLFAATISCVFSACASFFAHRTEENKERIIEEKMTSVFAKKTDEINNAIKIALKQSDLVCGDLENILRVLIGMSLEIGEIKRIRILAHNSDSFSGLFTDYLKKKDFKCKELNILVHNPEIERSSDVVKEWHSLYNNKEIEIMNMRQSKIERRSLFGIIIEFDSHHPIGMIGFYKPQEKISPYKQYGVFSEGDSILDILDGYFDYYFENNYKILIQEPNGPLDMGP